MHRAPPSPASVAARGAALFVLALFAVASGVMFAAAFAGRGELVVASGALAVTGYVHRALLLEAFARLDAAELAWRANAAGTA